MGTFKSPYGEVEVTVGDDLDDVYTAAGWDRAGAAAEPEPAVAVVEAAVEVPPGGAEQVAEASGPSPEATSGEVPGTGTDSAEAPAVPAAKYLSQQNIAELTETASALGIEVPEGTSKKAIRDLIEAAQGAIN